ncbi:MAG: sigma-70 family RNA polymerase sigma factor [Deltaproteobacteria bacterium]
MLGSLKSAVVKEPKDEDAMARFQNGDSGAFDLLLRRHGRPVMRFIMKMAKVDAPRAEDLLQEVFIKVIEKRGQFNAAQKFTTWLYTLARNRCIDYLRTERLRCYSSLDGAVSEEGDFSLRDILGAQAADQEQSAIDGETQALLRRAVGDLREEFREVFVLREVEGLSLQEIAEITQSPLGTVKSRLRYAFQNLREVFIKAGYFEREKREDRQYGLR